MQTATGFCKRCQRQVAIQRPGVNHVLHLLLTMFTLGLWFPLWMLFIFAGSFGLGGWRCTTCGRKVARSLFR